jgi:DNA-binding NarL/FixJ family response regulator
MAPRVLIVDDQAEFRTLARAVLEAGGFVVAGEAADAATARTAVLAAHPDVVLLDVNLPDASGFDLAEELVRRESGLAIVMISTRDASDYGSRLETPAVRGFIPKSRLSGSALTAILG